MDDTGVEINFDAPAVLRKWPSLNNERVSASLGARGWDHFMMVYLYQEKIAPLGPLLSRAKPPDVLTLQHTIKSLELENTWLKEQLARIVRDK